jgi:hypothetical protein
MSEGNMPRREDTEGNVPRREDTETTQQRCPQQDVRLVVGAFVLGYILAIAAFSAGLIVGRKWCHPC